MCKLAPLFALGCLLVTPAAAAAADAGLTCTWENGAGLLQVRTSSSSGLMSITGRFALAEAAVCRNPLCLSEQRPVLLDGMIDAGRPIFDPVSQSALYVGRGVYGERAAVLEMSLTSGALKMLFSDGSQETFSDFWGCVPNQ